MVKAIINKWRFFIGTRYGTVPNECTRDIYQPVALSFEPIGTHGGFCLRPYYTVTY